MRKSDQGPRIATKGSPDRARRVPRMMRRRPESLAERRPASRFFGSEQFGMGRDPADDRTRYSEDRDPLPSASEDRDRTAEDRDKRAAAHDEESDARDERADARDERAESREHAAPEVDSGAAADRAGARRDRRGGASDRTQAADDREAASADRALSAKERKAMSMDELTGTYRRDSGVVELERDMARALRTDRPLTLAFVDIDGLKKRNDSRGHVAGDRLIRQTADSLRAHLRSYDLIIRFGGDEFLCALLDVEVAEAAERFSRVNADLSETEKASVTVGLAELAANDGVEELLSRADRAMYEARAQR